MLRQVILGAWALALSSGSPAASLAEDAKAFGTREQVQSMAISPNGDKVAMLTAGRGSVTTLEVGDLATGKITKLAMSGGRNESLFWCNFASNERLICAFGGAQRYFASLVGFSRLVTIRTDGSGFASLGQKASDNDASLRQYDGDVIDWLIGEKDTVLVARAYIPEVYTTGSMLGRTKVGLGVDRINLNTMKAVALEPARRTIDGYLSDGHGNVRVYSTPVLAQVSGVVDVNRKLLSSTKEVLTGEVRYKFRRSGSRDWEDLGIFNTITREGIYPLAIDAESDTLFVLKKLNGRNALYRMALDGSGQFNLVARDDAVDIDNVVRLGRAQKIIGYTYADDRRRTVYFDPEFADLQRSLAEVIPNQPLVDFLGASTDGRMLLVHASADRSPGDFYRYDRRTQKLEQIIPVRPELAGRKLAHVQSIRISAADGAQIPAYLTLPPGSPGRNLPAVVLPHGGPSARDEWGFDWVAQFLAARGYAVIQPNYRGSAGYGQQWESQNGFRGWKRSIGDVTASARYLVQQGIADPNRLAIMGWSYGGYAALQSAAVEPSLYKAAVAVAPVTDLALFRRESSFFTNERLVEAFIGDGPHLVQGSPIHNIQSIGVPILLIHGENDANVSVAHSDRMYAELRAAGKPAELIRFEGLDHQLADSNARIRMLTRIGEFLESRIGH